jgi:hypothetical protein
MSDVSFSAMTLLRLSTFDFEGRILSGFEVSVLHMSQENQSQPDLLPRCNTIGGNHIHVHIHVRTTIAKSSMFVVASLCFLT